MFEHTSPGRLRFPRVPLVALAPLVAIVAGLLIYSPVTARVYFQDLPTGVLEVSIADTSDDATTSGGPPAVQSTTPTIRGRAPLGTTSIEVTILSTPQTFTVPVDPATGEWEFTVPVALEAGLHTMYIDGTLVGSFTVAEQAVSPPSTGGAGLQASATTGPLSLQWQVTLFALAVAVTATLGLIARRRGRTTAAGDRLQ